MCRWSAMYGYVYVSAYVGVYVYVYMTHNVCM